MFGQVMGLAKSYIKPTATRQDGNDMTKHEIERKLDRILGRQSFEGDSWVGNLEEYQKEYAEYLLENSRLRNANLAYQYARFKRNG